MAFPEDYYVDLRGEQKGPYSFPQLKRMYDLNLIPEEALYWQDGMEHWQPLSDLCGAERRLRARRMRRLRIAGAVIVAGSALLIACCAPTLKEGWRETEERDYSAEAAYWKARGFVREQLKARNADVAFDRFDPANTALTGGTGATVLLPGTVFPKDGAAKRASWKVAMLYHASAREWTLPEPR